MCGGEPPHREPSDPATPATAPAPAPATAAAPTQASETRAAVPRTRRHRDSWYEVTLPGGATRARFEPEAAIPAGVTDMFLVDPVGRAAMSFFHPMPYPENRASWTAKMERMFRETPSRTWEGELAGEPATLSLFARELRWTLVVDGFGVMVKCLAEAPRDEAWFHERCDPVAATVTLHRPLTESVPPFVP